MWLLFHLFLTLLATSLYNKGGSIIITLLIWLYKLGPSLYFWLDNCLYRSKRFPILASFYDSEMLRKCRKKRAKIQFNFFFDFAENLESDFHAPTSSSVRIVQEPYEILAKPWHRVYMGFYCILWLFGLHRPITKKSPITNPWKKIFISNFSHLSFLARLAGWSKINF